MTIIFFSLLFFAAFLLTKSYKYLKRYYPTVLYVSFISIAYTLICTNYGMWTFPVWWIFTDDACALFQATILFPSTTVMFLRYLPTRKWLLFLYFCGFAALYIAMEWIMVQCHEIRYSNGWNFGWSAIIDFLMFIMICLHEYRLFVAWVVTIPIMSFFIIWFHVPLFVL